MAESNQGHVRKRGNSYQAVVYTGRDSVTRRKRCLRESAPTEVQAEEARKHLLDQVTGRRQ